MSNFVCPPICSSDQYPSTNFLNTNPEQVSCFENSYKNNKSLYDNNVGFNIFKCINSIANTASQDCNVTARQACQQVANNPYSSLKNTNSTNKQNKDKHLYLLILAIVILILVLILLLKKFKQK